MPNNFKAYNLGNNVNAEIEGNTLTLRIDVSPTAVKSGRVDLSRRLRAVAKTYGSTAVTVSNDCTLYLTLLLSTKAAPKGHGNGADTNPRRLRNGLTGKRLTAAMLNDMGG